MEKDNILQQMTPNLFWDIDPEAIDLDTCPAQIIQRVLEYGEWNDWQSILYYYGLPQIVDVCKKLRTLDPRALSYICTISNTNKEEYRCYHIAQSNPTLWNS